MSLAMSSRVDFPIVTVADRAGTLRTECGKSHSAAAKIHATPGVGLLSQRRRNMRAHQIGLRIEQVILAVPFVLVAGCAGEAPPKQATATLESRSGSTVTGKAVFTAAGNKVTMELTVAGATPGDHAVHLHAVGDCGAADATSAMGHFNPDMMNHGLPTP